MTPTVFAIEPSLRPIDRLLSRIAKRTVDFIGALIGLVVALPFGLIFGFLIWKESPKGPVFFRQKRIGKNGIDFTMIKFRTMHELAEKDGPRWAEQDDSRCLRIGSFMRQRNIDEIPQFLNVLRGEMSLVGPRPERPNFVAEFSATNPSYNARHSCLPGMSGWAQVNGWRGNTSLKTRTDFDLWYIENWSLALDLRIIVMSIFAFKNAC